MAITYRPDIDGLRALAVVPVVVFHSGLPIFPGGYVGVDVFFVISGYLITSILLEDVQAGKYSVLSFYERRVRRIFPALFVVLAACSVASFSVMFAHELYEFAHSLIAAAFFYSNYFFMFDAGYFAAPSETKPLLHIWSLAVEEQFYIVFPIYLYAILRLPRRIALWLTIALLLTSLAYSIYLVRAAPADAFFSAPSRFWELLAGAVLAMVRSERRLSARTGALASVAGLALILYAVFAFSDATAFPGLAALAPVAGSALLIATGTSRANPVAYVLAWQPVRFIGLISYSLYLWHWPVLVYFRLWKISEPSLWEILLLMGVTFGLAALTWKYVEQPFRRKRWLADRRRILQVGVVTMLVTGAAAQATLNANGFPARYPEGVGATLAAARDVDEPATCFLHDSSTGKSLKLCRMGSTMRNPARFAFWGDSHALALFPALNRSAENAGTSGVFTWRGGCPPLLDVRQSNQDPFACPEHARGFLDYVSARPEIRNVILAGRWSIYAMGERYRGEDGRTVYILDDQSTETTLAENRAVFRRAFLRTVEALAKSGKRIVIVTQVPETEFDIPTAVARQTALGRRIDFRPRVSDYEERNALVSEVFRVANRRVGIVTVSPHEAMCAAGRCKVTDGAAPIYRDSSHLTATFAATLASVFDPVWAAND